MNFEIIRNNSCVNQKKYFKQFPHFLHITRYANDNERHIVFSNNTVRFYDYSCNSKLVRSNTHEDSSLHAWFACLFSKYTHKLLIKSISSQKVNILIVPT